MSGKGIGCCIGCIALGAIGAALYMQHRDKMRPMATNLVAKGLQLKDKALDYAARTKEQAEDIIAEAKQINEAAAGSEI